MCPVQWAPTRNVCWENKYCLREERNSSVTPLCCVGKELFTKHVIYLPKYFLLVCGAINVSDIRLPVNYKSRELLFIEHLRELRHLWRLQTWFKWCRIPDISIHIVTLQFLLVLTSKKILFFKKIESFSLQSRYPLWIFLWRYHKAM